MITTKRRIAVLLIATLFAAAGAFTAASTEPAIDHAYAAKAE